MHGMPIDASFIFTGSTSNSEVRIYDNPLTIVISGDPRGSLDIDLTAFDSHNVGWSFRIPIIKALRKIGVIHQYEYGPEKIPYDRINTSKL